MEVNVLTPIARQQYGFDRNVTEKQRALIEDTSGHIHVCAGRRSGKTFAIIVKMLRIALGLKDSLCWYLTPSRDRAKSIVWPALRAINTQYGLSAKFNDSDLMATFPTGGVIRLTGIEDVYHSDRLRGFPAMLYAIDEAQSYRPKVLDYLIDDAISAAMTDYVDSQIIMAGTPSNIISGYFYDNDKRNNANSTWSCHHFTVRDNQYFKRWRGKQDWQEHAEHFLAEERQKKGWSETNSTYQREWLAQWHCDNTSFYYTFSAGCNTIADAQLPNDLKHVIGIDIGHRQDPTALVVLGYNEAQSKNCYVVDSLKLDAPTQMEQICAAVKDLDEQYAPELVVGDYAGGGSFIFEEVAKRYDIHIQDAKKAKKSATTEFINSELHEGRLKVAQRNRDLIEELKTIRWDNERKRPDPSYPNDLSDAAQYAFSEVYSYLFKPPAPKLSHEELVKREIEAYWQQYEDDNNKEIWTFDR